MTSSEQHPPQEIALANYLLGYQNATEAPQEELAAWQVPFYSVAIGALRRAAGQETVPEGWFPAPLEGAELYREVAYERKHHTMVRGLHDYVDDYKADKINALMRDDQRDVMDALVEAVAADGTAEQINAKSPTGSGKTRIYANLVAGLKYREDPADPVRALVLAPTTSTTDQAFRELQRYGGFDVAKYSGHKRNVSNITVMTYQSFQNALSRGDISREMFDVVVRDESDTFAQGKTHKAIDEFCFDRETGKNKLVVGVSATNDEAENLKFKRTLIEGLQDGILAPVHTRTAFFASKKSLVDIYLSRKAEGPIEEEVDENAPLDPLFEFIVNDRDRNQLIIDEVVAGLNEGKRVIVRTVPGGGLLHARILEKMLNDVVASVKHPYYDKTIVRKIRSVVVGGELNPNQKLLLTNAYNDKRKDLLDVLLTVGTLIRGFDSPITGKVINGAPTWSAKLLEQFFGRLPRKFYRQDGTLVVGEAVDIADADMAGLRFRDILDRDAPKGMRYKEGAIIGPDLRDLRDPDSEPLSAFEPIPPEEQPEAAPKTVTTTHKARAPKTKEAAPAKPETPQILGATALLETATPLSEKQSLAPTLHELDDAAVLADMTQEELLTLAGKMGIRIGVYRDPYDEYPPEYYISNKDLARILESQ